MSDEGDGRCDADLRSDGRGGKLRGERSLVASLVWMAFGTGAQRMKVELRKGVGCHNLNKIIWSPEAS